MKTSLIGLSALTTAVIYGGGFTLDAQDWAISQDQAQHAVAGEERIDPGLVTWHGSRSEAQAAAAQSGKPVLLFQLLGRLDEAFC